MIKEGDSDVSTNASSPRGNWDRRNFFETMAIADLKESAREMGKGTKTREQPPPRTAPSLDQTFGHVDTTMNALAKAKARSEKKGRQLRTSTA